MPLGVRVRVPCRVPNLILALALIIQSGEGRVRIPTAGHHAWCSVAEAHLTRNYGYEAQVVEQEPFKLKEVSSILTVPTNLSYAGLPEWSIGTAL